MFLLKMTTNTSTSIVDLCDDVLCNIYKYLDQKSCQSLSQSCKRFYGYSLRFGYLKTLRFSYDTSYVTSLTLHETHKRTIEEIIVERIPDPEIWLIDFAKIMYFYNCNLSKLDPPFVAKTEVLYISQKVKRCRIKKQKFPKLRRVLFV